MEPFPHVTHNLANTLLECAVRRKELGYESLEMDMVPTDRSRAMCVNTVCLMPDDIMASIPFLLGQIGRKDHPPHLTRIPHWVACS